MDSITKIENLGTHTGIIVVKRSDGQATTVATAVELASILAEELDVKSWEFTRIKAEFLTKGKGDYVLPTTHGIWCVEFERDSYDPY